MLIKIAAVDRAIVNFFQGLLQKSPVFSKGAQILAAHTVYLIPIALVVYWFWAPRWRLVEIRAVVAGLFAWQVVNRILQAVFERSRPVDANVSEVLFSRPADSFPSNHAALSMAVFLTLFLAGERNLAWVVLGLLLIISLFRVVTGLHFPSDILVGWFVGAVTAVGIQLLKQPFDDYIGQPLLKLAKLIKIA